MSYTREVLERWLKTIDVRADRVLDIGGAQLPIKGRTKSWATRHYMILDLTEPHQTKEEPQIKCDLNQELLFSADNPGIYKESFDCVFCIEVSEYWWNPIQALKNINQFMKPGGVLYLSAHFIYPVHNPVGQDYLRYTAQGIKKLLQETGFEIEELTARPINGINIMSFYSSQGMRPAKEYSGHSDIGYLIKAIKNG